MTFWHSVCLTQLCLSECSRLARKEGQHSEGLDLLAEESLMNLGTLPSLLKEAAFAWYVDRGSRLSAALAFYTLLSLAPLLIIITAIAALVYGPEVAHAQFIQQIQDLIGSEGAKAIETMIENASKPSSGVIATVIGLGTLLFGATIVFGELQDALNGIWKIPSHPACNMVIGLIRERFLSFIMVLGIGFLLLIVMLANTILTMIAQMFGDSFPFQAYILRTANFILFVILLTILYAMLYKLLPDTYVAWSDALIGAILASLLFSIGKFLIGL
jgi:membrane protein